MIGSIKLIWSRIPKKTLFSSITFILGYFGKWGLDYYLLQQQFKLSSQAFNALLGSAILISVYFLFSFIYFGLRLITEYRNQKVSNSAGNHQIDIPSQQVKKKKSLPSQFEIEVIGFEVCEFTIFVKRWWLPNLKPPGVEEFIRAIEFSDARCGTCHSNFYVKYHDYSCTNTDCKNKQTYSGDGLYSFTQKVKAKYFGDVRKEYKKYWDNYCSIYNDYTHDKPEEYADP